MPFVRALMHYVLRACMVMFWIAVCVLLFFIPRIVPWKKYKKELNVLVMPNLLDSTYLSDFEKEHNIKINLTYAESNDEIVMKLRTTRGYGYDLIMVSDYSVPGLIAEELIQPLDKKELPFFKNFYTALIGHDFDPQNDYSVPYYWGVYGFGIDTDFFGSRTSFTWGDIFDKKRMYYDIGTREDPRELICMAAFYLFGRVDNLGEQEFNAIKKLLVEQKKHVRLYADERVDTVLVSKEVPLVVSISGDIVKAVRRYKNIAFVVPQEGSFLDIDSFVVPASTAQLEEIHLFLRYLYRDDILEQYLDLFDFFSPLKTITVEPTLALLAIPTPELFERLRFFAAVIPPRIINDIILALKTA